MKTALMQPVGKLPTVKEMARQAGVSERLIHQVLSVHRYGVPEISLRLRDGSLSVGQALVLIELPVETQLELVSLPTADLHRAIKNLRTQNTARMQSPILKDLHALAAGALAVSDFLDRHQGARIPKGDQ